MGKKSKLFQIFEKLGLTPTSPESLVEDLQEIAFSKARRAVRNLRFEAGEAGIDSLSAEEIEKEIQAVRKSAK
jgi:hypothetical protein